MLRMTLPAVVLWGVNLLRRRPSSAARRRRRACPWYRCSSPGATWPKTIVPTIRSALSCGFLEVIFVDDHSSDDCVLGPAPWSAPPVRRDTTGKPGSLNVALALARGESSSWTPTVVQHGAIPSMLAHFRRPKVGAVAANLRVRNALEN